MRALRASRRAATQTRLCVHRNIEVFSLVVVNRKERQSYLAYMIYEIIKETNGPPSVLTEARMIFRKAHRYSNCNQAASLPRPEGMALIGDAAQSWLESVALDLGAAKSWPQGVPIGEGALKVLSFGRMELRISKHVNRKIFTAVRFRNIVDEYIRSMLYASLKIHLYLFAYEVIDFLVEVYWAAVTEVQNIPVCANAVGGNFFISRDVLGKRAGGKNRRWGKFLEITEHSAPLRCQVMAIDIIVSFCADRCIQCTWVYET